MVAGAQDGPEGAWLVHKAKECFRIREGGACGRREIFFPSGPEASKGEEGLLVGGFATERKMNVIDKEVDDASGNRPSQPCFDLGQKFVGKGGYIVGGEA